MNKINFKDNKFSIDNRIIPLFNVPITMKNNFEVKTNKYLDLNKQTDTTGAILRTAINNNRDMVNLYSKALEKYNSNISKIEESKEEALNKLYLIGEIKEDSNNINSIYKNYLYLINRYLPYYIYHNSFFKLGLFLPGQVFKPQFYSYKYENQYFPLNLLPEGNLRQYSKKFKRGFKTFSKSPFFRKNSLKKIIKGNLALLFFSAAKAKAQKNILKRNLIAKYFTLNTNVINAINIRKKVRRNRDKVIVDNNLLPLKPYSASNKEIIINQGAASALFKNSNNKVFLIWHDKEVKILLNNIIKKGDSLINELNSLIIEKQNIINNKYT